MIVAHSLGRENLSGCYSFILSLKDRGVLATFVRHLNSFKPEHIYVFCSFYRRSQFFTKFIIFDLLTIRFSVRSTPVTTISTWFAHLRLLMLPLLLITLGTCMLGWAQTKRPEIGEGVYKRIVKQPKKRRLLFLCSSKAAIVIFNTLYLDYCFTKPKKVHRGKKFYPKKR